MPLRAKHLLFMALPNGHKKGNCVHKKRGCARRDHKLCPKYKGKCPFCITELLAPHQAELFQLKELRFTHQTLLGSAGQPGPTNLAWSFYGK